MDDGEPFSQPVLNAVVRDVRTMATILRAIAFTPLCQFTASRMGLQVITEVNGVIQATAYLSCGLFASYDYNASSRQNSVEKEKDEYDEEKTIASTVFEVSLSDLLVCLNIYGNAGIPVPGKAKESEEGATRRKERDRQAAIKGIDLSTEMRLLYQGSGSPLILELQEGSTNTRCELTTFIANTALLAEMSFLSDQLVGQVIMQSKDITEALQSIDTSTKEVTFSFLNNTVKKKSSKSNNDYSFNNKKRTIPINNGAAGGDNYRGGGSGLQSSSRGGSSSIIFSTADDDSDDESDQDQRRVRNEEHIQMMRIKSQSDSGSTELDFPNQHKVFEQFSSTHDSSTSYHFIDVQRCLKAFQTSTKTSIRIDEQGMMSLQCLFPRRESPVDIQVDVTTSKTNRGANHQTDPERHGFVELKIVPINSDEDNDD